MGAIIELIENARTEIHKAVDLQLSNPSASGGSYRLGLPDPALDRFFPEVSYSDLQLMLQKLGARRPTIASIVATDGEIPMDRDLSSQSQEIYGNVKLARGRMMTEADYNLLYEAEKLRSVGNTAAYNALIESFLASPLTLVQSIRTLMRAMVIRVATLGRVEYIDPETTAGLSISYTNQIPSNQLPTPLTGNARWSQLATANGIANIVTDLNNFYANYRQFPQGAILIGGADADNLRSQNSSKLAVARMLGRIVDSSAMDAAAIASLPRPTLIEVEQAINLELTSSAQNRGGVPGFLVTDAEYYRKEPTNAQTPQPISVNRFLPANYYCFASPGFIEAARLPTASNNFADTMSIVTEELSKEPPRDSVKVATRFLPLCPDPRMIMARNVENTPITG